jgi:hypothetical protein
MKTFRHRSARRGQPHLRRRVARVPPPRLLPWKKPCYVPAEHLKLPELKEPYRARQEYRRERRLVRPVQQAPCRTREAVWVPAPVVRQQVEGHNAQDHYRAGMERVPVDRAAHPAATPDPLLQYRIR